MSFQDQVKIEIEVGDKQKYLENVDNANGETYSQEKKLLKKRGIICK